MDNDTSTLEAEINGLSDLGRKLDTQVALLASRVLSAQQKMQDHLAAIEDAKVALQDAIEMAEQFGEEPQPPVTQDSAAIKQEIGKMQKRIELYGVL